MKRLLTSSITSTAKQPIIQETLEFLQDSYKEIFNAFINGLITYTTNDVIKIYGCVVSGSGPYAVTAGAIYYNGEFYLVDAASGLTPGGGQTIVWDIVETFDVVDPVTFSDLSTHNVHQISKIGLIVGASGSGISDYNAATVKSIDQYIPKTDGEIKLRTKIIDIGDWDMDTTNAVTIAHGLNNQKIRAVDAIIRDDTGSGDNVWKLGFPNPGTLLPDYFISAITPTLIQLTRTIGGTFDSANFDSTSYNRGWITITYEA